MHRNNSHALKRKSFPGDAQAECYNSDSCQASDPQGSGSKRARSRSSCGPEELFSCCSSGPAATGNSGPAYSFGSTTGWEASSNQHQHLHSMQQQQRGAFSQASPLQHHHPQQQEHHLEAPSSEALLHQAQLQQQSSQLISWTQPPQAFPVPQPFAAAAGLQAGGAEGDSMDEDTPGILRSNSAPDLHMMLQEPLQPISRLLMGGRQQPLGSSSNVGALVPYDATSTKDVIKTAHLYQQRQQVLEALQRARQQAAETVIEEIGAPQDLPAHMQAGVIEPLPVMAPFTPNKEEPVGQVASPPPPVSAMAPGMHALAAGTASSRKRKPMEEFSSAFLKRAHLQKSHDLDSTENNSAEAMDMAS